LSGEPVLERVAPPASAQCPTLQAHRLTAGAHVGRRDARTAL